MSSVMPSATRSRPTPEPARHEPSRPCVHFTPPANFCNDPNGCVYHDGRWHLFYQHNPFGDTWGHMSWGHASSRDLVTWAHHPVAIPEADGVMAFSGSAVVDAHDTAGFGAGALVAIYTGHHVADDREDQRLAYSRDGGETWTVYDGNPVLDRGGVHFRDPKVFWHEPTGRWVMVVLRAVDRVAQFYGSDNLKSWTLLSEFGEAEASTSGYGAPNVPNWECPDLFELPVEGEPGETRWVLKVDIGDNAIAGGSGGQYFVGRFDGERFHPDHPPEKTLWLDHGRDFYAAQSWNHAPDGRRTWIGWMSNWRYAGTTPTFPWRGQMSVPRELRLVRTPRGIRLRQRPVPELTSARGDRWEQREVPIPAGVQRLDVEGEALDLEVVFEAGTAARYGLYVRVGAGQATRIGYDVPSGRLYVDRMGAGEPAFHPEFPAVHAAIVRPDRLGRVALRVIVDVGSVEVFANGGEAVISDLVFPDSASRGVALFAEGGEARASVVRAWSLRG